MVSPRGTCAAILAGRSETSKDWIARTPDSPAVRLFQLRSRPIPRGVTSPMPVTTTRRIPTPASYRKSGRSTARRARPKAGVFEIDRLSRSSTVGFDEIDGILDRHDLLGRIVR